MTNRTEQLHQLMATHGLDAEKVGELLNRSEQTVRIWRCKDSKRQIPEHALELLKTKVAQPSKVEALMGVLRATKDIATDRIEIEIPGWGEQP